MIKTYNPISEVRNESVELTKRIYRAITDVSRQLDERRGRVQTCEDLFLPNLEAQRVKLREYCERLIFTDPVGHGLKAEEILWRKGYYDVVATAKRIRKNNRWDPLETAYLQNHLSSGVGHYHHLIFRLQIEFKLDLRGLVDFPLLVGDEGLVKGKASSSKIVNVDSVKWAKEAAHRCLVYLGDLSRYVLDLYPVWDTGLTERYYLQALNLDPDLGMPHNQLGTLAGGRNHNVDAAYHYMRCLMCPQPFPGAEGNLQRIFEKNNRWLEDQGRSMDADLRSQSPAEHVQSLVARFLLLADVWFFDKNVLHISELCHQIVGDLVQCLKYSAPVTSDLYLRLDADRPPAVEENFEDGPEYLREDVISKIVVMSLLCAGKLKSGNSPKHSVAVAFVLAILSKLVRHVIDHVEDSVFHRSITPFTCGTSVPSKETVSETNAAEPAECELSVEAVTPARPTTPTKVNGVEKAAEANGVDKKAREAARQRKLSKLRRRRRRRSTNSSSGASEDGDSGGSDNEQHLAYSTDDEEEDEDVEDVEEVDGELADEKKLSNVDVENAIDQHDSTMVDKAVNLKLNCDEVVDDLISVDDATTNGDATNETKQAMDPADVIELVSGDQMFDVVKILLDWLRGDDQVVEDCSVNSRVLLTEITALLNLINIDADLLKTEPLCAKIFKLQDIDKVFCKIPLPEDVILKGVCLLPFQTVHKTLDWEYLRRHRVNAKEQALIRVYKLIEFGHFLVSNADLGVTFDAERRQFVVAAELPKKSFARPSSKTAVKVADSNDYKPLVTSPTKELHGPQKGTLMKSMHALWLRGEVKALESRKHGTGPVFSPYLAVDVDALIHHTWLVKQLVEARRFIILVPTVVITALDDLKKDVQRAREINRWLGLQHEKVNRFVRVQGPNEKLPIPLIKYPKKKDKEAWLFFQVVECCQYFNAKYGSNPNVPLVTLLSGQKNCSILGANDEVVKGFSPMGIAKSAGINLEYIETFHAKWKTSSKSHG